MAEQLDPMSFSGVDFKSGKPFDFKQYDNKVVYIDFWASWCAPCRESMPFLETLYKKYSDQGFEIIAINIDENKNDAENFLKTYPISYSNMYDPHGKIGKKLKIKSMPTAFLINKDGKLIARHSGFNSQYAKQLEMRIKKMIQMN